MLLVWVPLFIVNNYSEFQVNIGKCQMSILENVKIFARRWTTMTSPGLQDYLNVFFKNGQATKLIYNTSTYQGKG